MTHVKQLYITRTKKYGIVKFNLLTVVMSNGYFNPPRPAYYNPPIKPQYYSPRVFTIADIILGITTTVITNTAFEGVHNDYVVGQLVKLLIPPYYGSYQLNNQTAYVIDKPTIDSVVLKLNSLLANEFLPLPAYGPTLPQIIAIGDVNTGQINTGRTGNLTYIPGSFRNISPR